MTVSRRLWDLLCLVANNLRSDWRQGTLLASGYGRPHNQYVARSLPLFVVHTDLRSEPLRRNDLINAINKLVNARKQQAIINTRRFMDYVDYGRLHE